jgi:hypothetical protein
VFRFPVKHVTACSVTSSWRPLTLAPSDVAKRLSDPCEPNPTRGPVLDDQISVDDDLRPLAAGYGVCLMQGTMHTSTPGKLEWMWRSASKGIRCQLHDVAGSNASRVKDPDRQAKEGHASCLARHLVEVWGLHQYEGRHKDLPDDT